MKDDIALELLHCGLVQFGRFATPSGVVPVLFRLEYLASYPALLAACAKALAVELAQVAVDRLVCKADATPLAVALSLELSVPLVVGKVVEAPAASDLVGAYDVGHPACLVSNIVVAGDEQLWVNVGHRVGLDIEYVTAIIRLSQDSRLSTNVLFDVLDLFDLFASQQAVPQNQLDAAREFLNQNRRQGS